MSKMAKLISTVLVAIFMGTAIIPSASIASVEGRKNTAIGTAAASIAAFATGAVAAGAVIGAGSIYAWKRYNDEKRYQRHYYYGSGYGRGYGQRQYYYYDRYGNVHYYYR